MNRRIALVVGALSTATAAALLPLGPANAALDGSPHFTGSWDDDVCGVPVHVDVRFGNPVVTTGKMLTTVDAVMINTGQGTQRFTAADGRWVEDDFAGPVKRLAVTHNADGSTTYRIVADGIREEYLASNGDAARDVGHAVFDVLRDSTDQFVSLTPVSEVGTFPILNGQVDFCGFLTSHLS